MEDVIVKIGNNGFTTEVTFGKHSIVADEPEKLGGDDEGMAPLPLLLSSLGSCMVMTMRMYAVQKGWDLQGAEIRLSSEVQHSGLQQTTYIRCHINLEGELDTNQKRRIFDVSDKCPIKKMLTNPVVVNSNLLDLKQSFS